MYGEKIKFRCNVVETSEIVNAARRLENDGLKFFADLPSAALDLGKIDLVFTSGALQYVYDPFECLRHLVGLGGRFLFITRTALVNSGREKVIIQRTKLSSHGPGPLPPGITDCIHCFPVTFVPQENFEQILRRKYLIDLKIIEDKSAYWAAGEPIDMYGYFCSKHE